MKKSVSNEAKRYGIFYTPERLAQKMAKSAMDYVFCNHCNINEIQILDPACGDGRFLRAAAEILMQKKSAENPDALPETLQKAICGKNLFGIDRDKAALKKLHNELPIKNLQCLDALFDTPIEPKFDVVLANPPYVSYGLRNTGKLSQSNAAYLRRKFPDSAEYKIATYALFLELGVRFLKPGGVLSYLVPDSFLTGRYFSKLRKFLLTETTLRKIYLIREKIFPAVPGSCVILEAVRGKAPENHRVQCAELSGEGTLERAPYEILQKEFERNDLKRFILFFDEVTHRKVRRLEDEKACTLGDVLEIASGLIGKHGQKSIVFHGEKAPGASWRKGIVSGAAIQPGKTVQWSGDWLNTTPERIKSGLGKVDYTQPKLLFRQTGDRIICAMDTQGLYALNNVHVGVPKNPAVNLKKLAEYLNGEEMRNFYQSVTLEKNRPLAQIDIEFLRKIPLTEKVTEEILSSKSPKVTKK